MASATAPDRKLGEEWGDWDGSLHENDTRTPGWVFLSLAGLAALVLAGLAGLGAWLVYPRMQALGLEGLLLAASSLWFAYLALWYAGVLLTAWGWPLKNMTRLLGGVGWIVSPALFLGQLFGLSRDRLGHSFLLNHNRVEFFTPIEDPARLLVLAPRCLSRETMLGLRQLQAEHHFSLVVVAGGTEARRAIGELRPAGILGIACERDLLSGVKDVRGRVPVWTLPNTRPEGPCKNTVVPLDHVAEIVKRFLRPRGTSSTPHESGK